MRDVSNPLNTLRYAVRHAGSVRFRLPGDPLAIKSSSRSKYTQLTGILLGGGVYLTRPRTDLF